MIAHTSCQGLRLENIFFGEIYWSNILKNLTWFWHNQLAPHLLYNKDDKIDSDMILSDKEQSTSQTVTSMVIEVRFPQNEKLNCKLTHIK